MTPRHRLIALTISAMSLLAVATTAESRRLDVTDTAPTAAVHVSTAERPAPAATPPLDNPSPAALWACAANRNGVGGDEATVYRSRPQDMGVSWGLGWLTATCHTYAEDLYCNYVNMAWSNGYTVHTVGPRCVIVG